MSLRVGTRGSALAVAQTGQTLRTVVATAGERSWEMVRVTTTGDRITDRPLREAGGKGLFVKELDDALLRGEIDCAVHSLKDVPSELPEGIRIGAVLPRADVRDLLVSRDGRGIDALEDGSVLGTTSLRRASQALAVRPSIAVVLLRGNVETRLRRLLAGDFDAIFLAAAGVARLGLELAPARAVALDPERFIPAPGQGAVAITVRDDDRGLREYLGAADDRATRVAVVAERALARQFGGGCHLPLGAYARLADTRQLVLEAVVAAADGRRLVRDRIEGDADAAEELGSVLGRRMLEGGAAELVAEAATAAVAMGAPERT